MQKRTLLEVVKKTVKPENGSSRLKVHEANDK